jgi:hypothetical protein
MAEVTFYHQERVDGGRRSGVHVEGDMVLQGFVPGSEEYDPVLEWYVDVTVPTATLPTETSVRDWLVEEGSAIREALIAAADKLECGIDNNAMPWEIVLQGSAGPSRVSVAAIRRFTGRNIGEKLRQLAATAWGTLFPISTPVGLEQ